MFVVHNKLSKDGNQDDDIRRIIASVEAQSHHIYSTNDLKGNMAYLDLKKRSLDDQKQLVLRLCDYITNALIERQNAMQSGKYESRSDPIRAKNIALIIMQGLLRSRLDYNEIEWVDLFNSYKSSSKKLFNHTGNHLDFQAFPINYTIKQLDYLLKNNEASFKLKEYIQEALNWVEFKKPIGIYDMGPINKAASKLRGFISEEDNIPAFRLGESDIGPLVNEIISKVKGELGPYMKLFDIASTASSSKPSKKFESASHVLIDAIGPDLWRKLIHKILMVVIEHKPFSEPRGYIYYIEQGHQLFIKGLVWTLTRYSDKETIRILTNLCEKTYAKIPGRGPGSASIGNACIYVLGSMRGKEGLGALSLLKLKLRQSNVKKLIDKYLFAGAEKYNVSIEELKEMAVPEFKLNQGSKSIPFDAYRLEISLRGSKAVQQWYKPDDSTIKSVPSVVKNSTALSNKLKSVRKELKEIQKTYSAQKQRIDNQFILNRSWSWESFQKYYLDHGLIFPITTSLIWTFEKGDYSESAVYSNGEWINLEGTTLDWLDHETKVKLWHPVFHEANVIFRWREKIVELEKNQAIKQAFREIYIVTEAEINTESYSNRMAAHILKQHQFNSLAKLRDWKYALMGWYDDGRDSTVCSKFLPEHKITAEFWIDEVTQEDAYNETGIWHYVATDQVRFLNESNETIRQEEVPKIVFSEIMRDVDLFVGVSSVGNDPNWMDNNGERQEFRDYWTSYSFGDLSEIAKTRKVILEGLLPRLTKLKGKAHIEGRFLVVHGKLRSYKIHIGSGNILMNPNDQYLCIVPDRSSSATDRMYIPFEGDRGLSIVLSKAFMLVNDDKITDSSITSQIKRT